MEGGSFPKCGYCISAAHIRLREWQELHGWRVAYFQNVAPALATRALVLNICESFAGHMKR
eukprot:4592920-Pyramimonas_sp.AAC.1